MNLTMPELPEVETMCRGIASIVGHGVESVSRPKCTCRDCLIEPSIEVMHHRLAGRRIIGVERRGKRVMIRFDSSERLVIEPRMTGLVLLSDPPDSDHLRLQLNLNGGVELLVWDRRGLGTIRLIQDTEYEQTIDRRLGKDALSITAEELRERLHRSSRAIKVALLDQSAVAGIGNIYAAEILFAARVSPRKRCCKITGTQWSRIQAATVDILRDAILHEGSTLGDGTYRTALNDAGGYQNQHRVYDREAAPCSRCPEGIIRRIVQSQRATFYCPKCQK